MLRYSTAQNVALFTSLSGGETNRFFKAYIYKTDGTYYLGGDGSTPLAHISNGMYKSSDDFKMSAGLYKILYVPYLDSGFTTPDDVYGTADETLEIYSNSTGDPDFEVAIDDDDSSLDIEVDDSSEINVEIGD